MTTLRHSPDFNLILIPNTNVFFVFRFKSSKIAKLLSRIYWLVIMIWWWHCVETWHAGHWTGGAKFLIFFYHRSEARWCWWQAMLWSCEAHSIYATLTRLPHPLSVTTAMTQHNMEGVHDEYQMVSWNNHFITWWKRPTEQSSANSSQSDKKQGIVARTGDDCAQLSPAHTRLCPVYPARADTIVCSGDKGGGVSKVY